MSPPRSVVVIGSGISGTAAALVAASAGASVRVVAGAAGATVLSGGALDFADWASDAPHTKLDDVAEKAFLQLDFGSLPDEGVIAATTAGIVRPAAGADHALLDLDRVGRGAILVPRGDHPAWDAPALARCWGASPLAAARSVTFVALDAQLNRFKDERVLADAEIAARHDDDARLDWLAERLREVLSRNPGFVGVALPPWLGAKSSRAETLSAKVGIRCGEAITGLAGPSGARFSSARDRAFSKASVGIVSGWAKSARATKTGWRVDLEGDAWLDADAVVLASGGLIGGGLAYSPGAASAAAELPTNAMPTIRSTVACDAILGAHDEPIGPPSTLFGAQPEAIAWPFARDAWIERVGILVDASGQTRGLPSGFFACGDALADRPRAWLDALASGARAGKSASALP
jgi:glycerol-3-phosphate dehydrogenase subunit B